jgi:hypothetical protein
MKTSSNNGGFLHESVWDIGKMYARKILGEEKKSLWEGDDEDH